MTEAENARLIMAMMILKTWETNPKADSVTGQVIYDNENHVQCISIAIDDEKFKTVNKTGMVAYTAKKQGKSNR